MRYALERDRGDVIFALDGIEGSEEADGRADGDLRSWACVGRFLDGLVVRAADRRVSPYLRHHPVGGLGVPSRQSHAKDAESSYWLMPTKYLLEVGTVFRFFREGQLVTSALYVIDGEAGVL